MSVLNNDLINDITERLKSNGYSATFIDSSALVLKDIIKCAVDVVEEQYTTIPRTVDIAATHLAFLQNIIASNIFQNDPVTGKSIDIDLNSVAVSQIIYLLTHSGWLILPPA